MPSALHEAVARAIAGSLERTVLRADMDAAAAAAVDAVLGEAQRSIEALRASDPEHPYEADRDATLDEVVEVLAALARI